MERNGILLCCDKYDSILCASTFFGQCGVALALVYAFPTHPPCSVSSTSSDPSSTPHSLPTHGTEDGEIVDVEQKIETAVGTEWGVFAIRPRSGEKQDMITGNRDQSHAILAFPATHLMRHGISTLDACAIIIDYDDASYLYDMVDRDEACFISGSVVTSPYTKSNERDDDNNSNLCSTNDDGFVKLSASGYGEQCINTPKSIAILMRHDSYTVTLLGVDVSDNNYDGDYTNYNASHVMELISRIIIVSDPNTISTDCSELPAISTIERHGAHGEPRIKAALNKIISYNEPSSASYIVSNVNGTSTMSVEHDVNNILQNYDDDNYLIRICVCEVFILHDTQRCIRYIGDHTINPRYCSANIMELPTMIVDVEQKIETAVGTEWGVFAIRPRSGEKQDMITGNRDQSHAILAFPATHLMRHGISTLDACAIIIDYDDASYLYDMVDRDEACFISGSVVTSPYTKSNERDDDNNSNLCSTNDDGFVKLSASGYGEQCINTPKSIAILMRHDSYTVTLLGVDVSDNNYDGDYTNYNASHVMELISRIIIVSDPNTISTDCSELPAISTIERHGAHGEPRIKAALNKIISYNEPSSASYIVSNVNGTSTMSVEHDVNNILQNYDDDNYLIRICVCEVFILHDTQRCIRYIGDHTINPRYCSANIMELPTMIDASIVHAVDFTTGNTNKYMIPHTSHGKLHCQPSRNEYTHIILINGESINSSTTTCQHHQHIGHYGCHILYSGADIPIINPSEDTSIRTLARVDDACVGGSNNEIVTVYNSFGISEGTCMKIGGGMMWIEYTNQQLNVSDSGIINNGQHTIGHPMIDYASLLRSGTCRTSHDDEDTIGGNDNCGNHTCAPTTHVDMNIDTFIIIRVGTINDTNDHMSSRAYTCDTECAEGIMIDNDIMLAHYAIGTIGIRFVGDNMADSTTQLHETSSMMHPPTLNDSISSTDSKVVDSMSGNIDTISMQLFENRVSDYITNNHESTPRVKLYRNNNTDNTCTELSYEVLIRNDAHGCGENKEYYSANGGTFLCSGLTNDYDANYVERHCNELSIANTGSDITCTTRMNMPNHSGSRTNNKQSLQMMDHSKGHLNRAMAFERMDCSYCSRNSRSLSSSSCAPSLLLLSSSIKAGVAPTSPSGVVVVEGFCAE